MFIQFHTITKPFIPIAHNVQRNKDNKKNSTKHKQNLRFRISNNQNS